MPVSVIQRRCAYAFVGLVLATLVSLGAMAQPDNPLLRSASLAKDLDLPQETSSMGFLASPKLALYKPDGDGPFPALVLQHQCGGLRAGNWLNMSMLEWARTAVKRGYVVLQIDSLGPRGLTSVCGGPGGNVNFARAVRDALQAAARLAALTYVDPQRIVFAGYSWGAMSGALLSSKRWGEALAPGPRFRAAVSFYPGCFAIRPANGAPPYLAVNADIDRPLLVLMGGQDTETPPSECLELLEAAKSGGAPVHWHVYPEATHCWDCENLNRFRKTDFRGTPVEYRYSKDITADSAQRMFGFYEQVFAGKP